MANSNVVELNDSDFEKFISEATQPVLVDFWATWCAPCRMLAPIVDEIATENSGKYLIAKVDVDKSQEVAAKLGIRSIPTLTFFKSGEKKDQVVGVVGKSDIVRRLEALA